MTTAVAPLPAVRAAAEPMPHPAGVAVLLRLFFLLARRASWFPRLIRPFGIFSTIAVSGVIRRGTRANARRIFGRDLSPRERRRFTRAVVGHFYDFVVDVGRGLDAAAWQRRVAGAHGRDRYLACRATGRGAVLVTLHMGSFEAGLAALRTVEDRVSVVFLRDRFADFEAARSRLRRDLGVREIALDDGVAAMAAIPAALRRDEAVVMQGDRAYPGQRSLDAPFLGGTLKMPTGPARVARMCGSPLVPVAAVRRDDGRFDIRLGEPIEVDDEETATRRVAAAFAGFVARWPAQWLVLRPAFAEDAGR